MARPREFIKSHVIASAMEVFWAKGYQATSVADLVEATGLQRGSLYGAFGDKHALYLAALDAYTAGSLAYFEQLRASHDDPVDAVREFVRRLGQDCTDGLGAQRSCMVTGACIELASHDVAARERLQDFLAALWGAIASALAAGQERGSFAADRDPATVALFIQVSASGLNLLAQSRPGAAAINGFVGEVLRTLEHTPLTPEPRPSVAELRHPHSGTIVP